MRWRHADAARGSFVETDVNGIVTRRELDPLGADVGTTDPYVIYGGSYGQLIGSESLYGERGNPFNLANGCALDGVAVACGFAMEQLNSGAAMQEPGFRWGRRRVRGTNRTESFIEPIQPISAPFSSGGSGLIAVTGLACTGPDVNGQYLCEPYVSEYTTLDNLKTVQIKVL